MNQDVLQWTDMKRLGDDIRHRRWMFIGHIMKKRQDNDHGEALSGTPKGKRKKERPKTKWRRLVEAERIRAGWRLWYEVRAAANDRDNWRRCVWRP